MYVELGLLDHDPYWAALWPSSIALARGVAAAADDDDAGESGDSRAVVGVDACDLGAGWASPASPPRSAAHVPWCFTTENPSRWCCLLSAELNGLAVRAGGEDSACHAEVRDCGGRARLIDRDFRLERGPRGQRAFDLVLACDVLYESHAVAPVASLVPKRPCPAAVDGYWRTRRTERRKIARAFASWSRTTRRSSKEPREELVTHRGSTDAVLLLDYVTR